MVKEILKFKSKELADAEIITRKGVWRVLSIDNENKNTISVTFVKDTDDPDNNQENQERKTIFERTKVLTSLIADGTIKLEELIEFIALKYDIQQSIK